MASTDKAAPLAYLQSLLHEKGAERRLFSFLSCLHLLPENELRMLTNDKNKLYADTYNETHANT